VPPYLQSAVFAAGAAKDLESEVLQCVAGVVVCCSVLSAAPY